MTAKFAKAIAENIGTIAEDTTRIVLIDANVGTSGNSWDTAEARVRCIHRVEKAKKNIASILQQPGTWKENQQ